MTEFATIAGRLSALGFDPAVLNRYAEPHRVYHNTSHLLEVLQYLEKAGDLKDDELFLTAVYHDAIYDPKKDDNEKKSAELFRNEAASSKLDKKQVENISAFIMDTVEHKPSLPKSERFIAADLNILEQDLATQINYELRTFKEYQFVDFRKYQLERAKILSKINRDGKLDVLLAYLHQWKPSLGVFCGSFNPFHKGHYNILQKAEKIFDKVIIAFGKNIEKDDRSWAIPKTIQNRQIENYNGLLTDFVASLGYDVVVIRGLRNSTDFQYEQNQYRYIQELMPEIRIVNIFCDKEFEHISSSGIRTLEKFERHQNYLLD
jgi:pantetheine-phosphate adenylyltransferase